MLDTLPIASLGFAAPLLAGGMFLLALPLIAHLLNRRVRRRLVFPSLRFLQASSARQHHLMKLRRRMLLALRSLAILFVVMAFMLPRWYAGAAARSAANGQGAVVVLADLSASLGRTQAGAPLFHQLRTAAARTLQDAGRRGDVCNLVLAGARPQAAFPDFTPNTRLAERELAALEPLPERADLPGALALAGRLLSAHDGERQLVVLSDLQATNWKDLLDGWEGKTSMLPPDTQVTLIDPDAPAAGNQALFDPALHPAVAVAGQQTRLVVQACHYGEGQTEAEVELRVDDEKVGSHIVTLTPHQPREVAFDYRFPDPGLMRAEFRIPGGDDLSGDDQAFLACTVVERPPVVVVTDTEPDSPGSAAYYLMRAFSPHGDRRDHFTARHLHSYEVNVHQLQEVLAVVVADTEMLSGEAIEALAGFISRGGGVLMYTVGTRYPENAMALNLAVEGGCLPWKPGGLRVVPREQPLFLARGNWWNTSLKVFDPESREGVGRIPLYQAGTASELHDDARVLLHFSDGEPALGYREHRSGGRLLLAAMHPGRAAGDLGVSGFFVALNHALVENLQASARLSVRHVAGQGMTFASMRAHTPGGAEVRCENPGGERVREVDYLPLRGGLQISIPYCETPGFYEVYQGNDLLALAAANLDPRESDLRNEGQDMALSLLSGHGGEPARWVSAGAPGQVLPDHYRPLWGWMLAVALLALAVENTLLGIWRL